MEDYKGRRHHGTITARALYHMSLLGTHVSRRAAPNARLFRDLPPDGVDRRPACSAGVGPTFAATWPSRRHDGGCPVGRRAGKRASASRCCLIKVTQIFAIGELTHAAQSRRSTSPLAAYAAVLWPVNLFF